MNWAGRTLNRFLGRASAGGHDVPDPLEQYLSMYHESPQTCLDICLADLEDPHCRFGSSLHRQAPAQEIDVAAFIYSALRLPDSFHRVEQVMLYAREEDFPVISQADSSPWTRVSARARRRRAHFDGDRTLALFLTSVSDLDDLLPALCAIQIEWNKMHHRLKGSRLGRDLAANTVKASEQGEAVSRALDLNPWDWDLLQKAWHDSWDEKWRTLAGSPKNIEIKRLPLSQNDFRRAAADWWDKTIDYFSGLDLTGRPIFLVSSNTHCLANLLSGYTRENADRILEFVLDTHPESFGRHWQRALRESGLTRANLLYYALRLYGEHQPEKAAEALKREEDIGFRRHTPKHYPHLEVQVFPLANVRAGCLDPFLDLPGDFTPPETRAVMLNIDYPLGFAAHHLLEQALVRFPEMKGLYILGKSAAMIGRLGDIMIPNQVRDLHSGSLFSFKNTFTTRHLVPHLNRIAAFDDQKSITVRGAFLHGWETVKQHHRQDFTGLEMEAGPYLSALYEHFHQESPPKDENVRLELPPGFDLGLLHYTSDTPYNVRASLLSRGLGLTGLEAAYGCSRAILRRVLGRVDL